MRWCAEGELAELWRAAGLRDVRFGPLVVSATYTDFEDLWSPFPTGVAPSGAFCKSLDEDQRAALHDAYRRRLGVGEARSSDRARLVRGRQSPQLTGAVPAYIERASEWLEPRLPRWTTWRRGNGSPGDARALRRAKQETQHLQPGASETRSEHEPARRRSGRSHPFR